MDWSWVVSLLFWCVVWFPFTFWGVGLFASAFCLVLLVWTASALSQKAGCFKNCSPSAVLGWFAPLVVYCFVDLGVSALLF